MATETHAPAALRIGKTPLVRLEAFEPKPGVEIHAKLEFHNAGGSVKDRAALAMVEDGQRRGLLGPGQVLLDATSGNTGISYAMLGAARGFLVRLCVPANVTRERRQMLEAYGADLVLTDPMDGSDGAIQEARRIYAADPDRYFYPDQYSNDANWRAHYDTTGVEILEQTGGAVTHFVAGLGTAGTLMGVARFLDEQKPDVKIWAVEPPAGEMVDGLKNFDEGFTPPIFTDNDGPTLLDRKMIVRPKESIEWVRRLSDVGVFAGISSGAAMAGAAKCAGIVDEGVIVTLLADGGWKYLSTGAWTDDIDTVVERAKKTIYF